MKVERITSRGKRVGRGRYREKATFEGGYKLYEKCAFPRNQSCANGVGYAGSNGRQRLNCTCQTGVKLHIPDRD